MPDGGQVQGDAVERVRQRPAGAGRHQEADGQRRPGPGPLEHVTQPTAASPQPIQPDVCVLACAARVLRVCCACAARVLWCGHARVLRVCCGVGMRVCCAALFACAAPVLHMRCVCWRAVRRPAAPCPQRPAAPSWLADIVHAADTGCHPDEWPESPRIVVVVQACQAAQAARRARRSERRQEVHGVTPCTFSRCFNRDTQRGHRDCSTTGKGIRL